MKKILSMFVAICLILSVCSIGVSAVSTPAFVIDNVTNATAGTTYELPIYMKGFDSYEKGIAGIQLKVTFKNGALALNGTPTTPLTYTTSGIFGDETNPWNITPGGNVVGENMEVKIILENNANAAMTKVTTSGIPDTTVAILKVKVPEGTADGTVINLEVVAEDVASNDGGVAVSVKGDFVSSTTATITVGGSSAHTHTYDQEDVDDEFLKTAGNCVDKAVYYKSCSCGESSEGTSDEATFEGVIDANTHKNPAQTDPTTAVNPDCDNPGKYADTKCPDCGATITTGAPIDALGHEYTKEIEDAAYLKEEATCEHGNIYYYACIRCDKSSNGDTDATFDDGNTVAHTFTEQIIDNAHLKSAANCIDKAVYYYDCAICDVIATDAADTFEYGDVDANTHKSPAETDPTTAVNPDCYNPGKYADTKCPDCGATITTGDPINALGHEYTKEIEDATYLKEAATCEHGNIYYNACIRCDKSSEGDTNATFDDGNTIAHNFTEQIIDNAHLKSAANCVDKAVYYYDCAICDVIATNDADTFEYGDVDANTHKSPAETDPTTAVNPDCYNPGKYADTKCPDCGATITTGDPINALGHEYTKEIEDATYLKEAATCEHGNIYYNACIRCDKSSEGDTNATFDDGNMIAHSFTESEVAPEYLKDAADCENAAVYYKSCGVCGESSEGDTNETFSDGSPLGHSFIGEVKADHYVKIAGDCVNETIYYKSCDVCFVSSAGMPGEATFVGEKDNDNHIGNIGEKPDTAITPDCTESGKYADIYCDACGNTISVGGTIDPLGHDYKQIPEDAYFRSEATCDDAATYYFKCFVCGESSKDDDGSYYSFGTTLEHKFDEKIVDTDHLAFVADCCSPAKYYLECSNPGCSERNGDTFTSGEENPNNHDNYAQIFDEDSWVAPSCTTPGYSGDTICTGCGVILVPGEELAPYGHFVMDENWEITTPATENAGGEKTAECENCGVTLTVKTAKLVKELKDDTTGITVKSENNNLDENTKMDIWAPNNEEEFEMEEEFFNELFAENSDLKDKSLVNSFYVSLYKEETSADGENVTSVIEMNEDITITIPLTDEQIENYEDFVVCDLDGKIIEHTMVDGVLTVKGEGNMMLYFFIAASEKVEDPENDPVDPEEPEEDPVDPEEPEEDPVDPDTSKPGESEPKPEKEPDTSDKDDEKKPETDKDDTSPVTGESAIALVLIAAVLASGVVLLVSRKSKA